MDKFHMKDGLSLHFVASAMTGVFASITMNPFDVLATRLYNQPVDPKTGKGMLYKGWFDAFSKTASKEGLRGFYKVG